MSLLLKVDFPVVTLCSARSFANRKGTARSSAQSREHRARCVRQAAVVHTDSALQVVMLLVLLMACVHFILFFISQCRSFGSTGKP